jgi:hypothetical protein
MRITLTTFVFCAISSFTNLFAQLTFPPQDPAKPSYPNITLGGQIRYRAELDGRFFDATQKPLFVNMLRSQITLKAALNEDITAFIKVQDSRNFGETHDGAWRGTLDGRADNLDFREAWLEWRNFLTSGLSMKLGRQMFATNNERLIGALDWHNVGRAYDGATLTYTTPDKVQARAFGFVLGNDELLMTSADRQNPQGLLGIDLSLPIQQAFNVYLYHDRYERKLRPAAFLGMGDSTSFQRFTAGLYLKNVVDGWEYEFEGAYQFGTRQDVPVSGQNASIGGYLLTGYFGKRFVEDKAEGFKQSGSVGVGVDYYTGDNASTTSNYEGFNNLTTTIHKFYGYMDFFPFTILPNTGLRRAPAVTNYGLIDPYLRITYAPDAKTDMYLAGHYFMSQQNVNFPQNRSSTNLGIEIDATLNYKIMPFLQAQFGLSAFSPGEVMRETNATRGLGRDIGYWGYVMLTATF